MDLEYDFFSIDPGFTKPEKGKVLISEPFLGDVYFKRSVVLITEHNKEGSVGFVINKPVDIKMGDVMQDFPEAELLLSMGGPVGTDTIHFIHTLGKIIPNSVPVYDNLYWGGDFKVLKDFFRKGEVESGQVRFFIGYSGWAPGQLEGEINRDSWLIARLSSQNIMANRSEDTWKKALTRLGKKYKLWAGFPDNPDLN